LENGFKVTLVDISDFALEIARKWASENKYALTTKRVTLGEDTLKLDEKVDYVYSRLSIHYFDQETTIKVLRQIYASMKPGGKAFIVVKSPEDTEEMDYLQSNSEEIERNVYKTDIQIKSRFTKKQWEGMLEKAGITNFKVSDHTEDLTDRGDTTKSGNMRFLLVEIQFTK
ncbi:methyltransferase domain-containing protein, partial [Candidatus Dojkabacteria bacterium]|nr:methyltransferase domain-containing protein [Candidatus Dojkabacteria bacterium]